MGSQGFAEELAQVEALGRQMVSEDSNRLWAVPRDIRGAPPYECTLDGVPNAACVCHPPLVVEQLGILQNEESLAQQTHHLHQYLVGVSFAMGDHALKAHHPKQEAGSRRRLPMIASGGG